MSVEKGFGQGCGCVFGALAAVVVLVLVLWGANKFVTPCPSCHGTGNCTLCGGDGRGRIFGDCMRCGGKKNCPDCGGSGWKAR